MRQLVLLCPMLLLLIAGCVGKPLRPVAVTVPERAIDYYRAL